VWNHNTVYEWDTHVYENGREDGKIHPQWAGFCSVIENTPEVECSDEFDLILIIYMTLWYHMYITENKVSCSIEKMIVANVYDNHTHTYT
jgi:hypothetical protein